MEQNKSTVKMKSEAANNEEATGIWKDARFQHLINDPRFNRIPKKQRKVKIDKRFEGMFNDKRFQVKYTVDKYGRKVNKSNADDLRKFYDLENSNDSDTDADEKEQRKEEKAISHEAQNKIDIGSSTDESTQQNEDNVDNDALDSDGEIMPKSLKQRLLDPNIDYARGEGRLITDSSSDDETTDDEVDDPELYIDHVWGELDAEAEKTDEATKRLAICNMDWDRIRAVDLMTLFNSFLPPGKRIISIKIYTSEYGKQRLKEEEVHGPQELIGLGKTVTSEKLKIKNKKKDVTAEDEIDGIESDIDDLVKEQDSDAGEGDEYHMEKLRQYQLNRLRYYYAVMECDCVATAERIYNECDGIEYERSATRIDLRFISDDTTFDEDEPNDVCTDLPDMTTYKPRQFTTTALQQAKVDLTWDETAVERRELGEKLSSGKLEHISDRDLRNIVAYSSEEEEEEEEEEINDINNEKVEVKDNNVSNSTKQQENSSMETKTSVKKNQKKDKENAINKYKALLAEINEKEKKNKKKYELEFSWNIEKSKHKDDVDNNNDNKDIENSQIKKSKSMALTPIEKVLQKRNERNKKLKEERRRKKLKAKGIDPNEYNSDADTDSIPDGINMNDPYFAEEFANGDFIDPSKYKTKDKMKKHKKLQKTVDELEAEERETKELQLLMDDDDPDDLGKQHFSLEKLIKAEDETKSKKKRRKQLKKSKLILAEERKEVVDNFIMNLNDKRFQAVYTSHNFNIDPTDSHYKKTKGMEQIINEKLKRRYGDENENKTLKQKQQQYEQTNVNAEIAAKKPKKQLENKLLIKNLKAKTRVRTK